MQLAGTSYQTRFPIQKSNAGQRQQIEPNEPKTPELDCPSNANQMLLNLINSFESTQPEGTFSLEDISENFTKPDFTKKAYKRLNYTLSEMQFKSETPEPTQSNHYSFIQDLNRDTPVKDPSATHVYKSTTPTLQSFYSKSSKIPSRLSKYSMTASTVEPGSFYFSDIRDSIFKQEGEIGPVISEESSVQFQYTNSSIQTEIGIKSMQIGQNLAVTTQAYTTENGGADSPSPEDAPVQTEFTYERSINFSSHFESLTPDILPNKIYCPNCDTEVHSIVQIQLPTRINCIRELLACCKDPRTLERYQEIVHSCAGCGRVLARISP